MNKSLLSTLGVSAQINAAVNRQSDANRQIVAIAQSPLELTVAQEKEIANQFFQYLICHLDNTNVFSSACEKLGKDSIVYFRRYPFALQPIENLHISYCESNPNTILSVIPYCYEDKLEELTFRFDNNTQTTYAIRYSRGYDYTHQLCTMRPAQTANIHLVDTHISVPNTFEKNIFKILDYWF